ncbi:Ubiquitin [Spraguea lophii 42_110]|uniref:Ubiquitin n=1 Tax=Spraguea lophii (strain 42_110) TaxID=1358809 RepID=S7WE69_SPRLO|nr:Ubiquitin [Spraguea lophii 42_110]
MNIIILINIFINKYPYIMLIKIKTLSGRDGEIEVDNNTTILELKQLLSTLENIPPAQQRLIFFGKILQKDNNMLSDYNIVNGSIIHMVLALRGG